jgi:hypothetical protein
MAACGVRCRRLFGCTDSLRLFLASVEQPQATRATRLAERTPYTCIITALGEFSIHSLNSTSLRTHSALRSCFVDVLPFHSLQPSQGRTTDAGHLTPSLRAYPPLTFDSSRSLSPYLSPHRPRRTRNPVAVQVSGQQTASQHGYSDRL